MGTSAEARMGGMKEALGEVCEHRSPAELDSCVWTVVHARILARPKLPDIQKSHVWGLVVGVYSTFAREFKEAHAAEVQECLENLKRVASEGGHG